LKIILLKLLFLSNLKSSILLSKGILYVNMLKEELNKYLNLKALIKKKLVQYRANTKTQQLYLEDTTSACNVSISQMYVIPNVALTII